MSAEAWRVEKYFDDFPELMSDPETAMSLIAAEYELRSRREDKPEPQEYRDRFPDLDPPLVERIEKARRESEFQTAVNGAATETTQLDGVRKVSRAATDQSPATPRLSPDDQSEQNRRVRDYRLIEKIGEGGMGTVYRAVHEKLGRTVAIKFLRRELSDGEAAARFQREMLTVGNLEHPNVVRATDGGEVGGQHFLVMEYLEGIDAAKRLKEHGSLPIATACEIIRQAAEGLQHIHEQGLVHRDIKPSNLFLSGVTVKILDLGLARLQQTQPAENELSTTGQVMGTVDYMAPEQTTGGNVDIRADIYGLGATLYKLLTGVAPFGHEKYQTPMQKLIGLVQDEPTAIRDLRPEIPEELADVVGAMLEKDPDNRMGLPAEVSRRLEPFCCDARIAEFVSTDIDAAGVPTHPTRNRTASSPLVPTVRIAQNVSEKSIRDTRRSWPLVVGIALFGILLSGVLISIRTDEGEWRLTEIEPGAQITLTRRKDSVVAKTFTVRKGQESVFVDVGEYTVEARGADSAVIRQGTVSIQRGQKTIAEWTLVPENSNTIPEMAVIPFSPDNAARHQRAWAKYLGIEPTFRNSIGMELAVIPAGRFPWQRSNPPGTSSQIHTLEPVQLTLEAPYFIGTHEVRIRDFRQFVQATSYQTQLQRWLKSPEEFTKELAAGHWFQYDGELWQRDPVPLELAADIRWDNIGIPIDEEFPVTNVTPDDAEAFCEWLTKVDGRRYRLPREDEWEFACRSGADTNYYFGNDATQLVEHGNIYDQAAHETFIWTDARRFPHPLTDGVAFLSKAGSYSPNAFGLFDVYGNAREICEPGGPPWHSVVYSRGGPFGRSSQQAYVTNCSYQFARNNASVALGFRVVCESRLTPTLERDAAELVLAAGGTMTIGNAGKTWKATAPLPDHDFHILEIGLEDTAETINVEVFKAIGRCNRVRTLNLNRTSTTDTDLSQLVRTMDIRNLYLSDTKVTDDSLFQIATRFRSLNKLSLDGTAISDEGLKRLEAIPYLVRLDLQRTAITDQALSSIAKHDHLVQLDVAETQVTAYGIQEFTVDHPDCKVHHNAK